MHPIFIGGCDRSGTTLLAGMLDAADSAVTTPESQFKASLLRHWDWSAEIPRNILVDAIALIQKSERFLLWDIDIYPKEILSQKSTLGYRTLMERIVYCYAVQKLARSSTRYWIDHDPQNFRIYKQLLTYFPDAYFVHVIRDGRAVAASVLPLDWGPNTILKAARFWKDNVNYGLDAETFIPERVYRVRYEELIRNPRETLQALCKYIDLEFNTNMLCSSSFSLPPVTKDQHQLVGKPLEESRINAWRTALSRREIEAFEAETEPMLQQLGYDLTSPSPRPAYIIERVRQGIKEVIQQQINRRHHKQRFRTALNDIKASRK